MLLKYGWLKTEQKLLKKGVCHFLLVISSNLGRIFHHFRDMASFPLKNAHFSYPFYSTG